MACRNAYRAQSMNIEMNPERSPAVVPEVAETVEQLLFGVDSKTQANDLLQNNLEQFEWVIRNKIYPNFYGRYLTGEDCLTREEIVFLHRKGCKIAAIYSAEDAKLTEEDGVIMAKKIVVRALELSIAKGSAMFLEVGDNEAISTDFMGGFAKTLIEEDYTPAFKANTDARFAFDREFSRGLQNDAEVFQKCLIWSVAPTVKEYDGITTTHLIHPDNWVPYAPSGMKRSEIAIWQYGRECHPIEDDKGKIATFNLNLIRNVQVMMDKMF